MIVSTRWPIAFLLFLLFLPGIHLFSQEPFFSKIRFTLPQQEPAFQEAIQDHQGYLWLGSGEGLFRFDGMNFVPYTLPSDSNGLKVTALCEGPDLSLWIGCKSGQIFHLKNEKMSSFNPEEGTSSSGITDILFDPDGNMWWSTSGEGVYFYRENRVFNINREDGLSDDFVYDLEPGHSGKIFAATDNGVNELWLENGMKRTTPLALNSELPDIIVRSLEMDTSGLLWMGFQDGGLGLSNKELDSVSIPAGFNEWDMGPVQSFIFAGTSIWMGTSSFGIIQLNQNPVGPVRSWKTDDRGNSLGRIQHLLRDREGNIWILSSTGLFRSTGTHLQYLLYSGKSTLSGIHAVMGDDRGNLWYSNDEGLFKYDLTENETKKYLGNLADKNIKYMCLEEDRHGFIWAGTFDHGVFRLDPATGAFRKITETHGLVNNNVLSISEHHDTLWLATLGGASNIVIQGPDLHCPLNFFSYNHENGLVNTFIYDVYEDTHDRIWFATDGDGICVYSEDTFTCFNETSGLGDDVIYSITGDDEGNIWFSTASDGIYRYDGINFRHFGLEAGLRSTEISALQITGNEVVIVHDLGVDVLQIPSMSIRHYGPESGMEEIIPELNAIHKDRDENIWIGTQQGIIRYQPGNGDLSSTPQTTLEQMLVMLEPVEMQEPLSLKSHQNHVSFAYTGIWLSNPEKVIYRVMLEGYDFDWKETYDRSTTYSSLPPGNYTFRVRSSLDQAFSQVSEASFSFTVKRPFWVSVWFILLVLVFVSLIIYLYIRTRELNLRREEQKKKEKVEFEFQLLKNQINPHFLFNSFSTLISLIEEDRNQAMEYTEKLSDFFRKVLQLKETEIIPVREELMLIEDYLFIQRKRYGDLIRLEVILTEETLGSFIPPMTMQMLMENAVKHNIISKENPLNIKIYSEPGWIWVENTFQPKRQAETSTGIGLDNISKRYRLLAQKEIRIEQYGPVFRVGLPVI